MANKNSQQVCSEFLLLATRRSSLNLHGRWLPLAYWSDKIGIKDTKLKKVLENQSLLNCQLEDHHGGMRIETNQRQVNVDGKALKRHFMCITTGNNPEVASEKSNKSFQSVLQSARCPLEFHYPIDGVD